MRNNNAVSRRAARQRVKKVIADRARQAFCDVSNDVARLRATTVSPHGRIYDSYRWFLQAMRAELEAREQAPEGRYALSRIAR